METAFGPVDTSCLALGTCPLVFGRVASMGKASDLVGISSLGLGICLLVYLARNPLDMEDLAWAFWVVLN
jgi:hypothetical protein